LREKHKALASGCGKGPPWFGRKRKESPEKKAPGRRPHPQKKYLEPLVLCTRELPLTETRGGKVTKGGAPRAVNRKIYRGQGTRNYVFIKITARPPQTEIGGGGNGDTTGHVERPLKKKKDRGTQQRKGGELQGTWGHPNWYSVSETKEGTSPRREKQRPRGNFREGGIQTRKKFKRK